MTPADHMGQQYQNRASIKILAGLNLKSNCGGVLKSENHKISHVDGSAQAKTLAKLQRSPGFESFRQHPLSFPRH